MGYDGMDTGTEKGFLPCGISGHKGEVMRFLYGCDERTYVRCFYVPDMMMNEWLSS